MSHDIHSIRLNYSNKWNSSKSAVNKNTNADETLHDQILKDEIFFIMRVFFLFFLGLPIGSCFG